MKRLGETICHSGSWGRVELLVKMSKQIHDLWGLSLSLSKETEAKYDELYKAVCECLNAEAKALENYIGDNGVNAKNGSGSLSHLFK